eukprot:Phypoly_transcript_09610.p1 GENE.Phypoly_transcript_09610~~Phypoly_transcript_09610.p1  ORF type:complete len:438 (+),score=45.23 Phypoly_transcript_09610:26-1339(+)
MSVTFCLLFLVAFAKCYDIQEILLALSSEFSLEQGTYDLFNISECQDSATCYTPNTPESPYIWYNFSSWDGTYGHLRDDEVIISIHTAPPACLYFGYTPYLVTRNTPQGLRILYASLSDTMNMNVLTKGSDNTIALIISPNANMSNTVNYILQKFLEVNSTNVLPLPGSELHLGLDSSSDTFGILSRFSPFQNPVQGQNYLRNVPGYVYKLTPKIPDLTDLFSYPTFRPYGPTSKNENYLQTTLTALISAIRSSEPGLGSVQPSVDIEHLTDYQSGFSCINKSIDCFGDNRDTRFLRAGNIYIQNTTESHTWVVGVQHQLTGKATFVAIAVYDEMHQVGVLSVPHTQLAGSAQRFLPNNPDAVNLYAIKFARYCLPTEIFCFVVPAAFPGVPLDSPISFVERVYLEPGYNVAPAYGSILNPQFIRYKSNPPFVMRIV